VSESQPPALSPSQPAAVAPASTLLSALKDSKTVQAASDIETSLSSLAAQLGGTVGAPENLQTDFLSAFFHLLQTQAAVCHCFVYKTNLRSSAALSYLLLEVCVLL